MASGIARGRVRTKAAAATTTTVESRKMAAILQIIGWQRHAALVYLVLFWYMTCYDQLTPFKSSYLLTSTTWPYRGLKFIACRVHVFYWSWPLTKCLLSIGLRAHVRSNCWKQSWVVRKPVNPDPGLKVNQVITVFSLEILFVYRFSDY